jgi:selenoprotein W-related protein
LSHYQHVIEDLTLVTGSKGVFDVRVNGELIYSKHETKRHAEPGEVLALFTELVGPDVPRYGT